MLLFCFFLRFNAAFKIKKCDKPPPPLLLQLCMAIVEVNRCYANTGQTLLDLSICIFYTILVILFMCSLAKLFSQFVI